jgi:hypothetical protein
MKRLFCTLTVCLLFCGCTVIGKDLREALQVQNHYTRQYVEFTKGSVNDEQMKGIGSLLVENSKKIDAMIKE